MLALVILNVAGGILGVWIWLRSGQVVRAVVIALLVWVIGFSALVAYSWYKSGDYQVPTRQTRVSKLPLEVELGVSRLLDHYLIFQQTKRGAKRAKLPLRVTRIRRVDSKKGYVEEWHQWLTDEPRLPRTRPLWHFRLHRPPRTVFSHYTIVLPRREAIQTG